MYVSLLWRTNTYSCGKNRLRSPPEKFERRQTHSISGKMQFYIY